MQLSLGNSLTAYGVLASVPYTYNLWNTKCDKNTSYIYLGVVIDSKMTFSSHIDHITLKATRMLNFIKRNLCKCNKEIKCMAYLSLVRPSLKYAASAWDPYLIKDITAIEKIQRQAARWVTSNYDWRNGISITSTLAGLKWPTLAQHRQMSRLGVF